MAKESDKTDKVLETLKRSRPILPDSDLLSENVIRKIQSRRTTAKTYELIYEFFFGWVYVGWMRRIMVAAAVFIVLFFGYQQAFMLNRIKDLSGRTFIETGIMRTSLPRGLPTEINKYRLFGKEPSAGGMNVSEKEIESLIKSINDLQVRYRDLFELIEKDPELKKYVEERLKNQDLKNPNI